MVLQPQGPRTAGGLVAALLAAALFTGCSSDGPRVIVRGKLLNDGQPVTAGGGKLPPGDPGVRVVFLPVDQPGALEEPAAFDPATSTFQVIGPDGRGIKPGKYKVAVEVGAFGTGDQFKGRFGRTQTPIVRDVQGSGKVDLVIDLAKPEG